MNPKFFTELQLNRIWCIEQRQNMLMDSEKLIKEIKKKAGDENVSIPYNIQPMKGKNHGIRVRNYKANLQTVEQEVLDDMMDKILWTRLFLKDQGVDVSENILCQENQSSIRLEKMESHRRVKEHALSISDISL